MFNKQTWAEKLNRRILSPASQINFDGFFLSNASEVTISSNLKFCLVKQDLCTDLYCCPPSNNPQEIVFSTLLRTGMVGLFTKLNSDFYIVKEEQDQECKVWQERAKDENHLQFFKSYKKEIVHANIANHTKPQGYYALSVDEINWDKYDVIISINISIPNRIIKQYPEKLWCYYIQEPQMKSYTRSYYKPIGDYDLFFNQRFDYFPKLRNKKKHVIDFPYYIQYSGCFRELFNEESQISNDNKKGIFICKHTLQTLDEKQLQKLQNLGHPVYEQKGSPKEMIQNLLKSKYYLKVGGKQKRWGNAMIEGIASHNLFIGNPNDFFNKSLFTRDTKVKNIDKGIEKIQQFDNNHKLYYKELKKQIKLLNWLCFIRPIKRIEKEYYNKQL